MVLLHIKSRSRPRMSKDAGTLFLPHSSGNPRQSRQVSLIRLPHAENSVIRHMDNLSVLAIEALILSTK